MVSNSLSSNTNGVNSAVNGYLFDHVFDLITVGFGPASLAVAIAMHDNGHDMDNTIFVEKQSDYRWHSGMLIDSARMQISFLKDFATLRDPRSKFTFLNYLFEHDRLMQFSNLDTFLPLREDYETYMKWCASFFKRHVAYSEMVTGITPITDTVDPKKVLYFEVRSTSYSNDIVEHKVRKAKSVIVSPGGSPRIPEPFAMAGLNKSPNVIHSSAYMHKVGQFREPERIAVIGNGQSAAEIFSDLSNRFPETEIDLAIRNYAMKPADDSPFVNEIFNPEMVDLFYNSTLEGTQKLINDYKTTNYGCVRLGLLEKIYMDLYKQLLPGHAKRLRVLNFREVHRANFSETGNGKITVTFRSTSPIAQGAQDLEKRDYDAVFLATGYDHSEHLRVLDACKTVLEWSAEESRGGRALVDRRYKVVPSDGVEMPNGGKGGIWLQGGCEETHGISDSLLSILSERGAQVVDDIFGTKMDRKSPGSCLVNVTV